MYINVHDLYFYIVSRANSLYQDLFKLEVKFLLTIRAFLIVKKS